MALNLGSNSLGKFLLGSTLINKIYKGDTLVYNSSSYIIDYYVDLSGDNTDGLTRATAFNNLTTVNTQTFAAGDVIGFNGGDEFYGNLTLNSASDGTAIDPIVLTSYGTGQAIITGDEEVTGFTQNGDYWEKTMAETHQVFENDAPLMQARYPKLTTDYSPETMQYSVTSVSSSTVFICDELKSSNGFTIDIVGSYIQMSYYQWRKNSYLVTAFNNTTGQVTISGGNSSIGSTSPFYIIGHINLMDTSDEWVYDSGKLKIYSVSEPTNITATTYDGGGIYANGSDYITIDNLKIKGYTENGIKSINSDYLVVKNSTIEYCYDFGIFTEDNTYPTFDSNTFKGVMNNALVVNYNISNASPSNGTVTNNKFYDIALMKISTKRAYPEVPNAVRLHGTDNTFMYNEFYKIGYCSVRMYAQNTLVEKNYVEDWCLTVEDGGAYYSQASSYTNSNLVGCTMKNNFAIMTQTLPDTWSNYGLYLDDRSTDMVVTDNIVSGSRSGIFLHNTRDMTVTGNSIYDSTDRGILYVGTSIAIEDGGEMIDNTVNNNDYLIDTSDYTTYWRSYGGADWDFGDTDYNNFWNKGNTDDVYFDTDGESVQLMTLAAWKVKYDAKRGTAQETNSTTSLGKSVTADQLVHNYTNSSVIKTLVGTWKDLDENEYVGSITLSAYTGKILVQYTEQEYGSELLTNGDFATDTWWVKNQSTITGGEAVLNATSNYIYTIQTPTTLTMIDEDTYTVTFDVTEYTSGDFRAALGSSSNSVGVSSNVGTTGSYSFDLVYDSAYPDKLVFVTGGSGSVCKLDNVSLKEKL